MDERDEIEFVRRLVNGNQTFTSVNGELCVGADGFSLWKRREGDMDTVMSLPHSRVVGLLIDALRVVTADENEIRAFRRILSQHPPLSSQADEQQLSTDRESGL